MPLFISVMYRKLPSKFAPKSLFHLMPFSSFSSKVPDNPVSIDISRLPSPTTIDKETIEQLEKVSLVNFETLEAIKIVEEAIRFADQLLLVDTTGVQPRTTVLDERTLKLREDVVNEGECCNEIIANAKKTEEGYFVAPPGNIPLETKEYDLKRIRKQ